MKLVKLRTYRFKKGPTMKAILADNTDYSKTSNFNVCPVRHE